MPDHNGGKNFVIGFISGVVLGVSVGFLYAPQPGKETRAMLREKAEVAREKAKEIVDEAREKSREIIAKAKRKAQEVKA